MDWADTSVIYSKGMFNLLSRIKNQNPRGWRQLWLPRDKAFSWSTWLEKDFGIKLYLKTYCVYLNCKPICSLEWLLPALLRDSGRRPTQTFISRQKLEAPFHWVFMRFDGDSDLVVGDIWIMSCDLWQGTVIQLTWEGHRIEMHLWAGWAIALAFVLVKKFKSVYFSIGRWLKINKWKVSGSGLL